MFGFGQRARARREAIERLHAATVAASRRPDLYGERGLPDTVDGRFESLCLHVLLVVRRLRDLPSPAGDVAQDLVDAVFAHLEVAMRESGVGDMGVGKRMKKLARTYYDRTAKYEVALDGRDGEALAAELVARTGAGQANARAVAQAVLSRPAELERCGVDDLLAGRGWETGP